MNETLARRHRIHGIVEGALLGDIAIVFLLIRAFLPVPALRNILLAVAGVPFVMLLQRRGLKTAILASIASYVLFSALVGPLLALRVIDVAIAGILIGLGRRAGLGPGWNTLWSGPVYAILDVIIPTIATVVILQYPVKDIIASARNFVGFIFQAVTFVAQRLNAPAHVLHQLKVWEAPAKDHWQIAWIAASVLYGLLTMYLIALVSEMILRQVPEQTLTHQEAA